MKTTQAPPDEPARSPTGGLGSTFRIRIELWLAVVFMALAFGAGILIGVVAQPRTDQPTVGVAPVDQFQVAPPLTDQQIQQGLPAGHPSFSDAVPSGSAGTNTKSGGGETGGGTGGSAGSSDTSTGSP